MKVVLQRVSRASVTVDGRDVASIDRGFVILVGFCDTDGDAELDWMAEKIAGLRVFPDADGKMNVDLGKVGGSLLVVSQFTLYGDTRKGRRPSFIAAAAPELAERLYDRFVEKLGLHCPNVATGEFGAMMDVELVNDGPVTLVIER
ncbi:MAG: D-tyrosyl-tRNA(Tyr) deacylase [Gemmatimonadetes bacterium]|nr:D-tyrosyl-tRNA(Tyr) deacylase [Gemmatimonadota bacterium]